MGFLSQISKKKNKKMLFWLDSSLADAVEDNNCKNLACFAIERIVYSQIFGNHLYYSDPKTLNRIINYGDFNERVKSHLVKIFHEYPQKGIFRDIKKRIEVVWGEKMYEIISENEKWKIRISADVVLDSLITERAIFLGENNRDIEFYKNFALVFMYENRFLKGLSINFDPIGGGGNNICDQYDVIQKDNKKLCLCIVDTDCDYNGDSLGQTAKNLINRHDINFSYGSQKIFCEYMLIKARESENLIPSPALYEIEDGNPNRQKFLYWLEAVEQINSDARFYVDIKNGMKFNEIIQSRNSDLIHYWTRHLKQWLTNCSFIEDESCGGDCICFEVPGMGNNTLDNVLEIFQRLTTQKIAEMVRGNQLLKQRWLEIGENIYLWFVCTKPTYVN
jgi:hypothetical protein